ncbi:MAG: hypothetical protein H6741_20795 [Alphaproteobacteria bacterium]|nr:hypothetical protein [Alphaproteobacteria bacterium]MCB9795148.1 hypothetical protein [Alphaproteobacteria bacterium]
MPLTPPSPAALRALGALALAAALAIAAARLPRPEPPTPLPERPRLQDPDGSVVDRLAERAGLHPLLVEHLLDPPLLTELLGACPVEDPLLKPLCEEAERTRAAEAVDQALAEALGDADPFIAGWARELSCELGPRGAALSGRVLAGQVQAEAPARQRAQAVVVRAWTLPEDQAVAELEDLLEAGPELALPAALELARLGRGEAELRALASRLEGADAALAQYAAEIAGGTVEVERRGL